jgi:hypothetical protein
MLIREPLRFSTGRGVKRKVLNRTIGDGPDCKNLSVIRSSKGFGHSSMFFCQLRKKFFFFFFLLANRQKNDWRQVIPIFIW